MATSDQSGGGAFSTITTCSTLALGTSERYTTSHVWPPAGTTRVGVTSGRVPEPAVVIVKLKVPPGSPGETLLQSRMPPSATAAGSPGLGNRNSSGVTMSGTSSVGRTRLGVMGSAHATSAAMAAISTAGAFWIINHLNFESLGSATASGFLLGQLL